MSELNFKGKEFVFNHHLAVPHRPPGAGPRQVDWCCTSRWQPRDPRGQLARFEVVAAHVCRQGGLHFHIDPPYNTGNEGWGYNDNVNSPMMQEWLRANPIGIEDGLRHDKWCAMMWPRLRLLRELLSDTGSIWITLDHHEAHRARQMLDELFR